MPNAKPPAVIDAAPLSITDELEKLIGETGAEGLENVTSSELTIPRLVILQPVSKQLGEGFNPGDIVNLTTKENYGKTVYFTPLYYFQTRTQWEKAGDITSPIECRSSDAIRGTNKDSRHGGGDCSKCPLAQWHEKRPPLCTLFKNILIVPIHNPESYAEELLNAAPVLYAAKRTATGAMSELMTMAAMLRIGGKPAPLFASIYKMESQRGPSEKGVYFVPKFSRHSMVPTAESFAYLRKMYDSMKAIQSQLARYVETSDEEATYTEAATDPDAPAF
jgi:hypothetical protein